MNSLRQLRSPSLHSMKQRGLVLFFALVALVVMSLAAVALIRSVDTSSMIAGNLAFKQASLTSADAGVEAATNWIYALQKQYSAVNVLTDPSHPFNLDNAAMGYYSNANLNLSLTDGSGIKWDNNDSAYVGKDGSDNDIRYVIQRMCRLANHQVQGADCLYSAPGEDKNGQSTPYPQDICKGADCPLVGQTPELRITVRAAGPKNSISYVQAFVY